MEVTDTEKRISDCYHIPENIKGDNRNEETARKAVDVAIYQAGIKEVGDNLRLACVNGNTEWQKLTNLRDVMKYYEAKLKEWG